MDAGQETTITVRGVQLKTWKEFQKAIIDQYGNLYGYLGPEVTTALGLWLDNRSSSKASGVTDAEIPADPTITRIGTNAYIIREALKDLGGEATIQQVISHLSQKYDSVDSESISTSMSDLATNGPPSSPYPKEKRFLKRVARGRYRLVSKGNR